MISLFPLVLQCDVKIVSKTFTASVKMKLISLTILTIILTVDCAHEHYDTFPPQFQTPSPGVFSSENSLYLPPESHTPLPYFPIRNIDKLPYPYLPPTGTRAPVGFPSPYPITVSPTSLPPHDSDENDDNGHDKRTSALPPFLRNKANSNNPTEMNKNVQEAERREMKHMIRTQNYHQPIDRIDVKIPQQFKLNKGPNTPYPVNQTPSARSMIISAETRNDHDIDQVKAGQLQFPQYLPYPGVYVSSTTETAVPILRLSNEMDLDGSFSYEALGADQTHYVQHSRMENLGTDKQEQVVEGSYSYVGDNGQTYTVHYVADSNGFRASGDHLPVAPPIPEIIQRAVQYNLAEEAKKPPNLKSWSEEKEFNESENNNFFAYSPPHNLFTGRTPESFSYSFSQGSNTQNSLATAASSQAPVKASVELTPEQMKSKSSGTISPQITFLASQGAHVPSLNTPQQTIARRFTTEKSGMPQLINYEAGNRELNQDYNNALWKWQFGSNSVSNQNPDKNTISRSSGEGDDIIINFSDMTPDQYSNMIKSQLEPSLKEQTKNSHDSQFGFPNMNNDRQYHNTIQRAGNYVTNDIIQPTIDNIVTSPEIVNFYKPSTIPNDIQINPKINSNTEASDNKNIRSDSRSKIITQNEFLPQSQTVTKSYDYEDNVYEPRQIKVFNPDISSDFTNLNVIPLNHNNNIRNDFSISSNNNISLPKETAESGFTSTTIKALKFTDFIVKDTENDFKPINTETGSEIDHSEITTEIPMEEEIKNNIFLKNVLKNSNSEPNNINKMKDDDKMVFQAKEARTEKSPKLYQAQPKPTNELRGAKTKPTDLSEILNYMSSKNNFESSKIKPRNRAIYNPVNEIRFIPFEQDKYEEESDNIPEQNNKKNHRNHEQMEELRGIIKNYKVLQRNNNVFNKDKDIEQIKRDLSPPPLNMLHTLNLPPLGRAGPSMKSYLPPIYV